MATADLEQQIVRLGLKTVLVAGAALVVLAAVAILSKRQPWLKLPLFLTMAMAIVIPTVILFSSTIYLNVKSESGGPVHWHADIEFWACGSEIELRDPHGLLSNKVGSSTYHEHDDKRIHLEGVVVKKSEDASLQKFMRVTGGYLSDDRIGIPLNEDSDQWFVGRDKTDGDSYLPPDTKNFEQYARQDKVGPVLELVSGAYCDDSREAELQVFVYSFNKEASTYSQRKLAHPTSYVVRDESVVPPGDCVIVEFDAPRDKTDKLCLQYGVRDYERCTQFGVKSQNPELCNIREVPSNGGGE